MKKINLIQYLFFIMVILVNTDCKKETPLSGTIITSPPPTRTNTAPVANAGKDTTIELPGHIILSGSAFDAEKNISIDGMRWREIEGQGSYIEAGNRLKTNVFNFSDGIYQFELSVIDSGGLYGKDTVTVTVNDNRRRIYMKDLKMTFDLNDPEGGKILVAIPSEVRNSLKYVYIKSHAVNDWETADAGKNPNYDYSWGGYWYVLLPNDMIAVYGSPSCGPGVAADTYDVKFYY